eukprot:RCo034403
MPTFYETLGLAPNATTAQIRKAYLAKALEVHPDKNPDPDCKAAFVQVHKAYQVLRNEDTRRKYDEDLAMSSAFQAVNGQARPAASSSAAAPAPRSPSPSGGDPAPSSARQPTSFANRHSAARAQSETILRQWGHRASGSTAATGGFYPDQCGAKPWVDPAEAWAMPQGEANFPQSSANHGACRDRREAPKAASPVVPLTNGPPPRMKKAAGFGGTAAATGKGTSLGSHGGQGGAEPRGSGNGGAAAPPAGAKSGGLFQCIDEIFMESMDPAQYQHYREYSQHRADAQQAQSAQYQPHPCAHSPPQPQPMPQQAAQPQVAQPQLKSQQGAADRPAEDRRRRFLHEIALQDARIMQQAEAQERNLVWEIQKANQTIREATARKHLAEQKLESLRQEVALHKVLLQDQAAIAASIVLDL